MFIDYLLVYVLLGIAFLILMIGLSAGNREAMEYYTPELVLVLFIFWPFFAFTLFISILRE